MAVTIFAAIDVGSYEVSMDIYQISPKIGIEKIDEVRSRIELGHDTYTNGKISYESAQRLGEVLGDFSRIMKVHVRQVPFRKQEMSGSYWSRFIKEPESELKF